MSPPPSSPSQIVVALGGDTASDVSLDIAQHLLRDVATELVGVFVEDSRLLDHAAAALALEIGYSGRARALESGRIERQLHARAADTRRRFEASANELKMRHDFRVLRGDVATELLRAATSAEALVVNLAADARTRTWRGAALQRLAGAPLPRLLLARDEWRTGRGIVAAIEHEGHAARVLEAGLHLAQRSRSPLTLLVAAEAQTGRRALVETARTLAASAGVQLAALATVSELTLETITRAARGARLLVLPRSAAPDTAELLAELVARTPLPLLMLGDRDGAHDS